VEYWLLFWGSAGSADSAPTDRDEAEIAERLRHGDAEDVLACPGVAEFRRDLLASDPDWTAMRLLPRPGQLIDRYLALVFTEQPAADELRDLRYVAARNRLTMYDPQVGSA
jgi:hypothetical protein